MASEPHQQPSSSNEETPLQEERVRLNQENDAHCEKNAASDSFTFQLMADAEPLPPDLPLGQRRALFAWLIVSTIIYGFLFVASLGMCLMSVMFFDAGVTLAAIVAAIIVLCIPLLILGTMINSWRAYNCRNYRLVILLNTFPTLLAAAWILLALSGA